MPWVYTCEPACFRAARHVTRHILRRKRAILAVSSLAGGTGGGFAVHAACRTLCHAVWVPDAPNAPPTQENLPMPTQNLVLIPIPGQPGAFYGPSQQPIPEPGTVAVLLVALVALMVARMGRARA